MSKRNRQALLAGMIAALTTISACSVAPAPRFVTLPDGYLRSGNAVGVLERRERRSLSSQLPGAFLGDTEVVFVPLRDARGPIRMLGHGWATDGRNVWCRRSEPEGKLADWRELAPPLYAMGDRVRYACAAVTLQQINAPSPSLPSAIDLHVMGCRTIRYRGTIYVQTMPFNAVDVAAVATFVELPIKDPASFHLKADQCHGWDAINDYSIDAQLPNPLFTVQRLRPRTGGASRRRQWHEEAGQVLVDGKPLPNADPSSFTFVDTFGDCSYAYDDQRVYFDEHPIPGADAASFAALERRSPSGDCVAFDRFHRYRNAEMLKDRADDVESLITETMKRQKDDEQSLYVVGPGFPHFTRNW